jgi:hypothetical protein
MIDEPTKLRFRHFNAMRKSGVMPVQSCLYNRPVRPRHFSTGEPGAVRPGLEARRRCISGQAIRAAPTG